jgi:hypothetical protein
MDTYEKIMYDRIMAHRECPDDYTGTTIEIASYHDGANVAIECTKCNEVIIDFDRPER